MGSGARRAEHPTMTEPVLVVETIAHVRAALMAVIEGDGYRTVGAASTSEALAKLRAGLRPCLILLDVGVRDVRSRPPRSSVRQAALGLYLRRLRGIRPR